MVQGYSLKSDHQQYKTVILNQLRSDQLDMDAINQMADEKSGQVSEMKNLMISKFGELHAILTPEQRVKLADHIEKRTRRFHRHHRSH